MWESNYDGFQHFADSTLTNPQMWGLLAKHVGFHIAGAFTVDLGVAALCRFGVGDQEIRHTKISTEIMIP